MAIVSYNTDPNMGFKNPVVGSDSGPDYANNITEALGIIGGHGHTGGPTDGVQIISAAININADLSWNQLYNITNLRSLRLTSQSSTLAAAGDVGCLYNDSGNLYYNNGSGTAVQVTSGTSVFAPAVGNNILAFQSVSTNLVILSTDTFIYLDVDTTATRQITLPLANAVTAGRWFVVKDKTGTAGTNNITVVRSGAGSDTIDGATSSVISVNYGAAIFVSNGSNAWTVCFKSTTGFTAGGDLSGSVTSQTVAKVNGTSVPATPTASTILVATGSTTAVWSKIFDGYVATNAAIAYGKLALTGSVVNADIGASAAIAGSKISPNFGSQALTAGTSAIGTTTSANSVVGSVAYTTRTVSGSFTIDTTTKDYILLVDTSAARSITLPAPTNGRTIIIKDIIGTCSTNNITVIRNGSESIDGLAASRVFTTNWGSWMFVSNGTDWFIL